MFLWRPRKPFLAPYGAMVDFYCPTVGKSFSNSFLDFPRKTVRKTQFWLWEKPLGKVNFVIVYDSPLTYFFFGWYLCTQLSWMEMSMERELGWYYKVLHWKNKYLKMIKFTEHCNAQNEALTLPWLHWTETLSFMWRVKFDQCLHKECENTLLGKNNENTLKA